MVQAGWSGVPQCDLLLLTPENPGPERSELVSQMGSETPLAVIVFVVPAWWRRFSLLFAFWVIFQNNFSIILAVYE